MKFSELFYKNLDFLQYSNKKFMVHQGGTSSTKTYSNLQSLIFLADKLKDEHKVISVVSESMPHLKRGCIRDFKNILGESFQSHNYNKTDNIYKVGKTIIEFFSADQSERLRGARRDYLFINECNNVPYDAFTELEIRTNEKVILDYNPTCEFWVHEKVMPRKDNEYIKSTYKDNPFLGEGIIKSIESRKDTDPNWWRVYGEGETGSLDGLVFKNWDIVSQIPPNARQIGYGQDFGYSNDPASLVDVYIMDNEIYVQEKIYQTGLTNQDLLSLYRDLNISQSIEIFADSAEPKSIEEISRAGYMCLRQRGLSLPCLFI